MNRLLLLLLVACQTIIYSGCSDRQPPPKPQTTIEADTQASSDTSEKPSPDTSEKPEVTLSNFVSLGYLYVHFLAGHSKEWELKPVTLIADVLYKDAEMIALKTDILDFQCGIVTPAELHWDDPPSLRWSRPQDKYDIGETYIFNLIIVKIVKNQGKWIVVCVLSEEVVKEEVFTSMTAGMFELIHDDLVKLTKREHLVSWKVCIKAEVEEFTDGEIRIPTRHENFHIVIAEDILKAVDTDKYQVGEEYTFFAHRIHAGTRSYYKRLSIILNP